MANKGFHWDVELLCLDDVFAFLYFPFNGNFSRFPCSCYEKKCDFNAEIAGRSRHARVRIEVPEMIKVQTKSYHKKKLQLFFKGRGDSRSKLQLLLAQ